MKPKMMGPGLARVKSAEIHAVVIRKDGTREELGVISSWKPNPVKRFFSRIRDAILREWNLD